MKYSVLTYIFGDYEHIHEVSNKQDDVEYVLVTDNMNIVSNTWKVVYWDGVDMSDFDKVCYVRYHPFEFVTTDICVKIDASIIVRNGDLSPIVNTFKDYDICLEIHPSRNLLYDEYNVWVDYRAYPRVLADNAYHTIMKMNYDEHYKGLYALTFSIQKNTNITKSINELTYSLIRRMDEGYCHRVDQIIYSFVLNKFFDYVKAMPVAEELITNSKYFQWCYHGTEYPIPVCDNVIEPYLFNKPTETIKF